MFGRTARWVSGGSPQSELWESVSANLLRKTQASLISTAPLVRMSSDGFPMRLVDV